jgi:hypothetical protein
MAVPATLLKSFVTTFRPKWARTSAISVAGLPDGVDVGVFDRAPLL